MIGLALLVSLVPKKEKTKFPPRGRGIRRGLVLQLGERTEPNNRGEKKEIGKDLLYLKYI